MHERENGNKKGNGPKNELVSIKEFAHTSPFDLFLVFKHIFQILLIWKKFYHYF